MLVILVTAPGPRMPNPMKATLTVGIGSQRNCNTSCCPAGRLGVFSLITALALLFFAAVVETFIVQTSMRHDSIQIHFDGFIFVLFLMIDK
jgi:hypothetical protein